MVGAGLYGAVLARVFLDHGRSVLVVDKRSEIGGNCRTKEVEGINVHVYGPHVFHTNEKRVWDFINRFGKFNNFIAKVIANYHGSLYSLPFNMNTFYELWGVVTPQEAKRKIASEVIEHPNPANLEEHVLSLAGREIYEKLVKGYTEKRWGRSCDELPASIMRRIPFRFTYDDNFFNDKYQGIPVDGYTNLIANMLDGADVVLNCDYLNQRKELEYIASQTIFTGPIDAYYNYAFGALQYRSLRYEHEILNTDNYQGCAVINYTSSEVPWTRVIEHKHFELLDTPTTVISKEYVEEWSIEKEPYYPIEDAANRELYKRYRELARMEKNIRFGGRLGEYRYYDMSDTIKSALSTAFDLLQL